MVRGIDKLREFLRGYEGKYVMIGGSGCEMDEEIYGESGRGRKEIEIIVIVEGVCWDFGGKLWEFVKRGG